VQPASAKWLTEPEGDFPRISCAKRNPIFYEGEPIQFASSKHFKSYEVLDYYGEVVDGGKSLESMAALPPGWYKLYLRDTAGGAIVGGPSFAVFRNDRRFPPLPPKGTSGGAETAIDEVVRGVTAMGPQRLQANGNFKDTFGRLDIDVALDRQYYLPFDPVRERSLLVAFPGGTKYPEIVAKIVARYAQVVRAWEPRNEPNFGASGADFARNELAPFYHAVKSVDPGLTVLGPGTVTIGPSLLGWIEDFLKAGGAQNIDAFSFHFYNNNNGDPFLLRKSLDTLNTLLKKYHADSLPKWQTEQGYMAVCYGIFQPRLEGRWTMLQMMLFEQYGIPKEHNHLWYDVSHGFWDLPSWWENSDGSINPAVSLMRVWSEELYGRRFIRAFDFGTPGNQLYIGDLFSGSEGQMAAFMTTGATNETVDLSISNSKSVRVVSPFGSGRSIPVRNGHISLNVSELPTYVEAPLAASISVTPTDWGANLCRQPGVSVHCSAINEIDLLKRADLAKVINGEFETWYWTQRNGSGPWQLPNAQFPVSVEIDLPQVQPVSRVDVYSAPPWQLWGSLVDYELQYDANGKWVTLAHVQEPTKTFAVPTPVNKTQVDSFYSDRWVFPHSFKTVNTAKIRLLVHDATYGGDSTAIAKEAGGQGSHRDITIREIELYAK
jgi:hypothetical protein